MLLKGTFTHNGSIYNLLLWKNLYSTFYHEVERKWIIGLFLDFDDGLSVCICVSLKLTHEILHSKILVFRFSPKVAESLWKFEYLFDSSNTY